MDLTSYFCIVHMPGNPNAEIRVLDAASDGEALERIEEVVAEWPGFERIDIYQGERRVTVLADPCVDEARLAA